MEKYSSEDVRENCREVFFRVGEAAARSGRSPQDIQIMAVTKTVPPDLVNVAIEEGISLLGENRVQEFLGKESFYHLEKAKVHFIGHLQTNKVKAIIEKVDMVQSLDSLRLAQQIDRAAAEAGRVMEVLVEVNIGREASKSGILPEETAEFLEQIAGFPALHVRGLMCIPPQISENPENLHFFENMAQLFIDMRDKKIDNVDMDFVSMGMSSDYAAAIEAGANLVRIGTALFGKRG